MRKLYALKWQMFVSLCKQYDVNPVNCPDSSVLEFFQECVTAGLAPVTLKLYVAAISANHSPFNGTLVGGYPLVSLYLLGARLLRPISWSKFPPGTWHCSSDH